MIRPAQTFCGFPFMDPNDVGGGVAVFGSPHGTPYCPGAPSHAAQGAESVRGALDWYSVGREQFDFDVMDTVFSGVDIVDCGDVDNDLFDGERNRDNIRSVTCRLLGNNAIPVLLGGDDSVPIPFIEAYGVAGFKDVTVVQVDAHIDWRDEVDGVTHGFSSTMRRVSEMSHVGHMIQVGARGPGSARRDDYTDALAWGSRVFTAREIDQHGNEPVIQAVDEGAQVILTIDVDGLDPGLVPGVILPAFGGLGYQQMLHLIHGIAARARIIGADFVEFVPERDLTGNSAKVIARLVSNVIAAIGAKEVQSG